MNLRVLSWNVSGLLWFIVAAFEHHDTYFVIGLLTFILAKLEEKPCSDKSE